MVCFKKISPFRFREFGKTIPNFTDPSSFSTMSWNFNAVRTALQHCRKNRAIQDGRSLHSLFIKNGSVRDVFLANNLTCLYADFGFFMDARKLFAEMPDKNVVSWTTMISAFTRAGEPGKALKMFTHMMNFAEVVPNGHTFSSALKACTVAGNLEVGKWIHRHVMELEMCYDVVLMNAALDMYVKCGSLAEAQKLFDGIPAANSTSWNTMIAGYAENGQMDQAEELFLRMPEHDAVSYNTVIAGFAQKGCVKALEYMRRMCLEGIRFDQFTYPCALKTCGSLGFGDMGKLIHCSVIKSGSEFDRLAGSALIDMYAKCGIVNEARNLFDQYSSHGGSGFDMLAVSNSMASGFVANGHNSLAIDLVSEIHGSGISMDAFTLSSALKACTNLQRLRFGLQVHALVVVSGYNLDHIVGSVLIDLYLKCGTFEKALNLFKSLPWKDFVAWSGMITGCVQYGLNHLAFSLFGDMNGLNVEVDHFILSSVLKACSCLAGNYSGKQVHAYTIKKGFELESAITTSLIDMYSKCGEIEYGLVVFNTASEKDTLCWTAIIVGCGQNGRANEAIIFLQEMLKSGAIPNEVTFLGILSACRHAGLVEDACLYFNAMKYEYGLVPCLEHYCCMVDILGRAGLIKEAWSLITDMPYEPDETIWNSFLGACGNHNDADVGKPAVECLHAASSCNTSMLVSLSNNYASLGMWDNTIKLRNMIREVGMKEAGISWVEVTN